MTPKYNNESLVAPDNHATRILMVLYSAVVMLGLGFSTTESEPKEKLSDYQFFTGRIADLNPTTDLLEYEVNAPLFTDYAEKKRMIYLPKGARMKWQPQMPFDFPTGSIISKNFYYWNDVAHPEKGRQILETRLLIKEKTGWKPFVYVWNAAQTDAFLEVTGATLPISWATSSGKKMNLEYVVPNLNQCKGCHSYDGQLAPIGITARQLNRSENGENQLIKWRDAGLLTVPDSFDVSAVGALFDYRKIHSESANAEEIANAARAYLDGNCAHCHNPHGPASTSGMFLEANQIDLEKLGVGKAPVAAGRGSGHRKYGIVPGKPGESILVFRMESNDPGIRMPELGRQLAHKEGLEIVRSWIKVMD